VPQSVLFPSFLRKQSLPWTRSGESMFIGTRRRKTRRKRQNISGDLLPINMDPGSVIPVPDQVRDDGSGTGVTGEEGDMDPISANLFCKHSRVAFMPLGCF
jgi:hypothetical protein